MCKATLHHSYFFYATFITTPKIPKERENRDSNRGGELGETLEK